MNTEDKVLVLMCVQCIQMYHFAALELDIQTLYVRTLHSIVHIVESQPPTNSSLHLLHMILPVIFQFLKHCLEY